MDVSEVVSLPVAVVCDNLYLVHLFWWHTSALLSLNGRPRLGPEIGPVAPQPEQRRALLVGEVLRLQTSSLSRTLSLLVVDGQRLWITSISKMPSLLEDSLVVVEVEDELSLVDVVREERVRGWGVGKTEPALAVRRSLYFM